MMRYWDSCWICALIIGLFGHVTVATSDDRVSIQTQPEGLVVKIDGEEFTVFHHGPALPKPYFWPVRGAGGAILTRPIDPNEKEHPHHRGIWLSVDEVNDIKFWAERGKIATREVKSTSGNPATSELVNEWLAADGVATLLERTRISIYPDRLIAYDTTVSTPPGRTVRFDDTKEGFFGIRIAQSMREKEGGMVVNSDGKQTTQECWGRPAKWVDYTGVVETRKYGVTLMDHPGNFRPSRYHVRDYGLFSMSPFGEGAYQNDPTKSQPVTLDEKTPALHFRYGLFVHSGDVIEGRVGEAYDQFLQVTKSPTQK